jgi:two-component system nitrogen regulation sensor histidine kinase NtrY
MPPISQEESKRRKRERLIILVLAAVVGILTYVETKVIRFGAGLPVSNTIITFILINLNMLLLLLLIFLVLRNIVKLLYDRKRKVIGARLRTKLVLAFAGLSLVPTVLLFFFSVQFISSSVAFWFNLPVEQTLNKSLGVGRQLYQHVQQNNRFFLERISYQVIHRNLLEETNRQALRNYVQVVQRAFNLQAVEVYSARSIRLAVGLDATLEGTPFEAVSADDIQNHIHTAGFTTLTGLIPAGEMIRTLGCIPANAAPDEAIGVIAATTIISPELSENMAAISRGFEQYQQMKMVKKPIQGSHLVTLSIVALLIIFCATWFGFYLAKTLTIPIQEVAEGTRRVAEGDLDFTIDTVADDEMGILVSAFNKMTRDLKAGKQQLELSAQELKKTNIEIEQRRIYMETVLRDMSTGVVSLDTRGVVTTINKSAEKMLGVRGGQLINTSYEKALNPKYLEMAEELFHELHKSANKSIERTIRVNIEDTDRTFMVHITGLQDEGEQPMGTVIVFDDLTEQEKAQRMAAWREVARRIAHEVKNPLTPIKLSAQRLQRKYGDNIRGDNGIFSECTQTIIDQVDQIRNLVNEFSSFARLPAINLERCYLQEVVREAVALFREAHPKVSFNVEADPELPLVSADRAQIKRALINLIDNAISAMNGSGTITIRLDIPEEKMFRIQIADTGTGISSGDKARLFEPHFSTKKSGMGLGLSIVNTVIEDHNGTIRVEDNVPKGTQFIIDLPL